MSFNISIFFLYLLFHQTIREVEAQVEALVASKAIAPTTNPILLSGPTIQTFLLSWHKGDLVGRMTDAEENLGILCVLLQCTLLPRWLCTGPIPLPGHTHCLGRLQCCYWHWKKLAKSLCWSPYLWYQKYQQLSPEFCKIQMVQN